MVAASNGRSTTPAWDDIPLEFWTEKANEFHTWAVGKGFWNEGKSWLEQCALFSSEVSEAVEHYRNGQDPQTIFDERSYETPESMKPDGIPIEMADVMIRVLDSIGMYKIEVVKNLNRQSTDFDFARCESFVDHCMIIHRTISTASMWSPETAVMKGLGPLVSRSISRVLYAVVLTCDKYDIDLLDAIDIKMAHNETRPMMHSGKRM